MKLPLRHSLAFTALGLACVMLTPYWHFFPLAWIGFGLMCIPVYREPRLVRDSILGYGAGLAFWVSRVHSVPAAYGWRMFLKIVCLGALPWLLIFVAVHLAARRSSTVQKLLVPVLMVVLLLLAFGLTPVDSLPIEILFDQPLAMMQVAALPLGLTALIAVMMLSNTSLAVWVVEKEKVAFRCLLASVGAGVLVGAAGVVRLSRNPPVDGGASVALLQTNLPVSDAWRVENSDLILETYREMAMEAAEQGPELIVFPQYSLAMFLSDEETLAFFEDVARKTGCHVAVGTFTEFRKIEGEEEEKRYNVGFVFAPDGGIAGSYRAASNLPFRRIGEAFGETYEPIPTPLGEAGMLLCYDDAVRRVTEEWVSAGVDYFLVLSNPSSFTSEIVRNTQLVQDQLRAIESGKPLIRVSANGVSGLVDEYGRWRVRSPFDRKQIVYAQVP